MRSDRSGRPRSEADVDELALKEGDISGSYTSQSHTASGVCANRDGTELKSAPLSAAGLAILLTVAFMGVLDIFVVYVALPSIESDLEASFRETQYVAAGYTLAYAVGLTTGGRIGDMWGWRSALIAGLIAFTIASVVCAFSESIEVLIVARIVQGAGASLMLPQVLAIIRAYSSDSEYARSMALYAATAGLASIFGQIIGGFVLEADLFMLGWRLLFLINVPLGVTIVSCVLKWIPCTFSRGIKSIDLLGAVALSLFVGCLIHGASGGMLNGWSPTVLKTLSLAVLSFFLLTVVELRRSRAGKTPILPLRMLSQRPLRKGVCIAFLFYGGNAGLFLILSYFLQSGMSASPLVSGLVFTPLAVGFAAFSLASRKLIKISGTALMAFGAGVMLTSLILTWFCVFFLVESAIFEAIFLFVLFAGGAGQGLVAPTLLTTIMSRVDSSDAGVVSGGVLTVAQVSNALGIAVIGSFYGSIADDKGQSSIHAFSLSLLVLAFVAAAVIALALSLSRIQRGGKAVIDRD